MPHCVIEYSANLGSEADPRGLLRKVAAKYAESDGVFPTIGIRVRGIEVRDQVVGDGHPDNAFVHAVCTVSPGRSDEFLQRFFGEMFEMMKQHLARAAEQRFIGLSLEVVVGSPVGSFRHNFGVAS
jgi:5-carboxymethyl-2-hydroxymuconate isomerase